MAVLGRNPCHRPIDIHSEVKGPRLFVSSSNYDMIPVSSMSNQA